MVRRNNYVAPRYHEFVMTSVEQSIYLAGWRARFLDGNLAA
jgi:hypothetical protein